MFGFGLLVTIIGMTALYGLAALAVISYAAYRKNLIVPDIKMVSNGYDEVRYGKVFSESQKSARDMWECVQVFSAVWPAEIIAGLALGGWKGLKRGIAYLVSLSGNRAQQATDRQVMIKLDEAREEALAIDNVRKREMALASIDKLATQHSSSHLALTGGN